MVFLLFLFYLLLLHLHFFIFIQDMSINVANVPVGDVLGFFVRNLIRALIVKSIECITFFLQLSPDPESRY